VVEGTRFCSACGASLAGLFFALTEERGAGDRAWEPAKDGEHGRFTPGELLAHRYRIVELVGRGGMGEVYHADDLTLEQPVALKFLPKEFSRDEERIKRFRREVRIARQIAHPNVCRVYDIGEVSGLHFLTMEYIDGENLGSLLRRIGRLPQDKAIDIARQLASGLAAALDKGVLHRDLKPANIMVDGRGEARITDFGLAVGVDNIEEADIRSGTPAYMAPEQSAGQEVTEQSDLYVLGLVLYEIFAGKRAFEAKTMAELHRLQKESRPKKLSSQVDGIQPAVERRTRLSRKRPSQSTSVGRGGARRSFGWRSSCSSHRCGSNTCSGACR